MPQLSAGDVERVHVRFLGASCIVDTVGCLLLQFGYGLALFPGDRAQLLQPHSPTPDMVHQDVHFIVIVGSTIHPIPEQLVDVGAVFTAAAGSHGRGRSVGTGV